MEKNLYTFSFNKLPKAFIVFVLILIVFESANIYFDDYFYSKPFLGLRIKSLNELALNEKQEFNILILGSCYSARGYRPKIITEKTKLSCYNFSGNFAQTVFYNYCILNNYLKTHSKKPKYIILSYLPPDLSDNIRREWFVKHFYDFSYGNWPIFSKEFGLVQAIKYFIPSVKHQDFFRHLFLEPNTIKIPTKQEIKKYVKQINDLGGYDLTKKEKIYKGAPGHGPGDFSLHPSAKKYFIGILNLARENNIKILWTLPGYSSGRRKFEKNNGIKKKYAIFVKNLQKKYSNLVVLNPRQFLNNDKLYSDQWHLNGAGANILSSFISEKINQLETTTSKTK